MAIDEVEGETGDDTHKVDYKSVTIAAGDNESDEGDASLKCNTAQNTVNNVSYAIEDDDDIILLDSDNRSSICFVIDDDDSEKEQDNLGEPKNISFPVDKIPHRGLFLESSDSDVSSAVEESLDSFGKGPKVRPSLRQYGRKQKKIPTSEANILPSKNVPEVNNQRPTVVDMNTKDNYLPEHQISSEVENNDGLKTLAELPDFTLSRVASTTTSDLVEIDCVPVDSYKSRETSDFHLDGEGPVENRHLTVRSKQESRPLIQQTQKGRSDEREEQEDIKFHLNKLLHGKTADKEDTKRAPVVVKMNEIPIIISENGVVTVIYKPDKVKFRRNIESSEKTVPSGRSPCIKGVKERREPGKRRNRSNDSKNDGDFNDGWARSTEGTASISRDLIKPDNGDVSLENTKRKQVSGLRMKKKSYPPIRKVRVDGEWVYKCQDCDFSHPDKVSALRRHMLIHQAADSIEWFHCHLCDYRAKRKGNLKIHMILHRDPNDVVWFKCDVCDKKFKHKNGLHAHAKRHVHREELEHYLCDKCSYKTPFKHTLLRHKINHEPTDKKKLLRCSKCSYSTYNKYYFARHGQTHGEPIYKCLLCSYEGKYKVNLESHMKRHYPQEGLLYCDSCDYSTNRRYTLNLHNRNVHDLHGSEEDQMFFCHNCSFETRFKRCLVKHISIHFGEPYGANDMVKRIKSEIMVDS